MSGQTQKDRFERPRAVPNATESHGKAVHLSLLGTFSLVGQDGQPIPISSKKNKALLAILALSPGQLATRERIAVLLWGDHGEEQARSNLRQSLAVLRKDLVELDAGVLRVHDETVGLRADTVAVDVSDFLRLAISTDAESLRDAVRLYRGDLLSDLGIREQTLEDWVSVERTRLRQEAIRLFDRLITLESGEARIAAAQRLIALDPLREASHRLLMQSYADQGENGLAIKQFDACKKLLRDEFDVDPAGETQELARRIAAGITQQTASSNLSGQRSAQFSEKPTIAVLPFINLSDDPKQDFFADALTEDIITELSRFRDHLVTDRNSSFAFKGQPMNLDESRKRLGVRYVVHGSVRCYGERFRISAQLVDATNNTQIWADRYDRAMDQIFSVQDELVQTIAGTLAGWLERRVRESARRKPTDKLDAYECFVQGRERFFRMLPADNRIARELFEKAISIDENFAVAYSWLAETHLGDWAGAWSPSPRQSLEQGVLYASTALRLDDTDSRTHATLARAVCWLREYEKARFHFDRALAINPSDAWALVNSARCFVLDGSPDQALPQIMAATRLNPLGKHSYQLGIVHFGMRHYDEAAQAFQTIRDPIDLIFAWLAAALALSGRQAEAVQMAKNFKVAFGLRAKQPEVKEHQTAATFLTERFPFRREEDQQHFISGLQLAGVLP